MFGSNGSSFSNGGNQKLMKIKHLFCLHTLSDSIGIEHGAAIKIRDKVILQHTLAQ